MAEFVKSHKGNCELVLNGHIYEQDSIGSNGTVYWRCVEVKSGCKGRAIQDNDGIREGRKKHDHPVRPTKVGVKRILHEIKKRAATQVEIPEAIVAACIKETSTAVQGQLPSISAMKKQAQRKRRAVSGQPAAPTSTTDFRLLEPYTLTYNGERFLLEDATTNNDRILIFATQKNLDILAESDHWMADGTFKTAPPYFTQLWTIHAIKYNTTLPLVFVLLPNKSKETYVRTLRVICERKPGMDPKSILTDFEQAEINAFKDVFPNVEMRGCFFHFNQCIWRKIQGSGELQARYQDTVDPNFAFNVRKISALAFVPVEDVEKAFEDLMNTSFFKDENNSAILAPLTDYFEDNWIGRPLRRGRTRRAPTFDVSL